MILAERVPTSVPVKTLVVDDSPLMRKAVQRILSDNDAIEVVGTASNGLECLDKIAELKPDVITLDIDMPVMNGISAVKNIMVRHQIPILIISSLIEDGYFAFEALRLGVMDFIPKPSGHDVINWMHEDELVRKRVVAAATMKVRRMRRVRLQRKKSLPRENPPRQPSSLVVMGTTLAGPNTVMHLVTGLPVDFDGVVIAVQEIHPRILIPFCSYFNEISPIEVIPVIGACPLQSGKVYIGSTFTGLSVGSSGDGCGQMEVRPADKAPFPIDRLFKSAAHHFRERVCGILLTGIGTDGAEGLAEIRSQGGLTIAQQQDCCAYPNLVDNVIGKGAVDLVLTTKGIACRMKSWADSLR